jgi:hypothetical protein
MAPNHLPVQILFVNKDSESQSLSHSRDVSALINSHAQRWRNAPPAMESNDSSVPFLFVNKDAQYESLSHSKDVSSSINSHAQLWRARQIRQEKQRALRQNTFTAKEIPGCWFHDMGRGCNTTPRGVS